MAAYVEALLLNMLFLVVFLLFIPLFIETCFKNVTAKQKQGINLVSVLLAMISCMLFPFQIGEEIIMDLRTVAIIVGGLYLGRNASVILIFVFSIFRLYIGGWGSGFLASMITSFLILIALLLLVNIYDKASKQKKISIACSFSLFFCTILLFIRSIVFNHLMISDLTVIIAFITIHTVSTFFIVFFYERIRETDYINQQVIKAEKLEVVSHLASSISHEVRNPLTVVKGVLQMLNEKVWDEEKRAKYIELSLKEIDRANEIIGNYLTFAKTVQQEHRIVDLEEELTRSIDVITPMANMNCVDIHTNMEPCFIKGDSQLLQQCFLNITKNCIEAMPNGGVLSITVKEIENHVAVTITDNGEGMTSEQLSRLGEPFYSTKGREGTGLGMMAVLKIIKMMNGRLHVTSTKNEGTQFTINFPSKGQ
jgi:two-component system, sporulation sensor kinase B